MNGIIVEMGKATHLSAQVDDAGVGVIEGQQNSVTGVHFLNTYRLIHVFLETQKQGYLNAEHH